MRSALLLATALLFTVPALADTPPPASTIDQAKEAKEAKVEMAIMPRVLVEMATDWIRNPDPKNAVQLYAAMAACLQDNPKDGVIKRIGEDQCPAVSKAIDAQNAAMAGHAAKP